MCSGGGALLCNVNKKSPLLNSVKRKLYVFLTAIFLSLSCFGEISHSYVTDNPNTQINKIETIKEREKAELNLSVTKIKSKEIEGRLNQSSKNIEFILPSSLVGKQVVAVEKLEDLPNPSTVNGRKILTKIMNDRAISNNLTQEIQGNNLIVNYENRPEKLYVSDLKGNFYKWDSIKKIESRRKHQYKNGIKKLEIDDRYKGEWIFADFIDGNVIKTIVKSDGLGVKDLNVSSGRIFRYVNWIEEIGNTSGPSGHYFFIEVNSLTINGVEFGKNYSSKIQQVGEFKIQTGKRNKTLALRLIEFPKHDFTLNIVGNGTGADWESHSGNTGGSGGGTSKDEFPSTYNLTIEVKYKVRTLEGQSVLTAKEYYPVNQFINFNSTTMEEGSPLALENSLRDVSLTTSGKGIVTMEQGDKLEIDGKQVIIGAGGNLAEQKATIGNLEYTYKVENGKLRLALNKWGVLEPDRNLMIRVWRTKDGAESKLVEHTLTVKSPRRVEGTSQLNYDNDYQIRTFVRFGGISLTAPGISSLETPVPAGVALSSQAGQGIPFMNEGDILEVNDGVTRAVHQFTIGAGGTLSKKQIKFNNSDVTLYVENGKLRAGLNNWIVNKPVKLNLRLIRGTNEIMNHAIGFKVPEAPFNIKENGLLDFGRVTAGSKRTAETNIVLEMLNDVDSVKFNLKDTQPVMENVNGKQLKVNEIQTIVKKQGERTYLVKLHGKLIIPEDTQMGEYSGSTILELRIK